MEREDILQGSTRREKFTSIKRWIRNLFKIFPRKIKEPNKEKGKEIKKGGKRHLHRRGTSWW